MPAAKHDFPHIDHADFALVDFVIFGTFLICGC
jgi:hypothetical protein